MLEAGSEECGIEEAGWGAGETFEAEGTAAGVCSGGGRGVVTSGAEEREGGDEKGRSEEGTGVVGETGVKDEAGARMEMKVIGDDGSKSEREGEAGVWEHVRRLKAVGNVQKKSGSATAGRCSSKR